MCGKKDRKHGLTHNNLIRNIFQWNELFHLKDKIRDMITLPSSSWTRFIFWKRKKAGGPQIQCGDCSGCFLKTLFIYSCQMFECNHRQRKQVLNTGLEQCALCKNLPNGNICSHEWSQENMSLTNFPVLRIRSKQSYFVEIFLIL